MIVMRYLDALEGCTWAGETALYLVPGTKRFVEGCCRTVGRICSAENNLKTPRVSYCMQQHYERLSLFYPNTHWEKSFALPGILIADCTVVPAVQHWPVSKHAVSLW